MRRRVGVHSKHADAQLGERGTEPEHELVDHRGLAGPAGAGDPDHRCGPVGASHTRVSRQTEPGCAVGGEHAILDGAEQPAEAGIVSGPWKCLRGGGVAAGHLRAGNEVLDHAGQTELEAVVRVIEALDAGFFELRDLGVGDRSATAAEHPDVAGAGLGEGVHQVAEVLQVAALVGGDRYPVGVLLQRSADHLLDGTVVPEVDHLGALSLDDPAHHRDRGIVPVEEASRGHETQRDFCSRLWLAGGGVADGGGHGSLLLPRVGARDVSIVTGPGGTREDQPPRAAERQPLPCGHDQVTGDDDDTHAQ